MFKVDVLERWSLNITILNSIPTMIKEIKPSCNKMLIIIYTQNKSKSTVSSTCRQMAKHCTIHKHVNDK